VGLTGNCVADDGGVAASPCDRSQIISEALGLGSIGGCYWALASGYIKIPHLCITNMLQKQHFA